MSRPRWNGSSCIGGSYSISKSLSLLCLLVLLDTNQKILPSLLSVESQTSNEPVNIGAIFSLPWDVANSLRAPIGGPVSLVLSVFMAMMLLFGFLLAPVNYILGYPPRIYHSYRVPGILGRSFPQEHYHMNSSSSSGHHDNFDMADVLVHLFSEVSSARFMFDRNSDYTGVVTGRELAAVQNGDDEQKAAGGFLQSIFLLVPEEDEVCRQLLVCHAHGFLPFLPVSLLKAYKLLSKNYFGVPDNYKEAILTGLDDQAACSKIYKDCEKGLFHFVRGSIGLIRQNIAKILPSNTKDLWQKFYAKYHQHSTTKQ